MPRSPTATTTVYRVHQGLDVLDAIDAVAPDLVILDEQIGNMGGLATLSAIRNAEGVDRIPITAVLVLLDRAHDAFLARRHDADGFLVKPLDSLRLRRRPTSCWRARHSRIRSTSSAASPPRSPSRADPRFREPPGRRVGLRAATGCSAAW